MPQFAVADTSSAAASLLNGLNAAANQQATLAQQKKTRDAAQAQQDLKDRMEAYSAGAVDVPLDLQSAQPQLPAGRPTLQTPSQPGDTAAAPQAQTASPYSYDPKRILSVGGQPMYFPTDREKGKSFVPSGQLGDALKSAGWDGKTPVTPEQSHSVMQALNEAQPKDEPYEYDASGKYLDAKTGKPVPGFIGKKSKKFFPVDLSGGNDQPSTPGAAPGGPFDTSQSSAPQPQVGNASPMSEGSPGYSFHAPAQTPGASPNGAFTFAPPEKAEKADSQVIVPGMQGPHGGLLVHDRTSNTVNEVPIPAGSKPVMTAAQTEADKDRHVSQERTAEDRATRLSAADQAKADKASKAQAVVQQKHDDYQSAEKDQWDLHKRFADLANPTLNPNGATVSIPTYNARTGEISDGPQRVMSDNLRGTMIDQSNQAQRKAVEQHGYAAGIRKSMGWGEFSPPASTQPPAKQAAQPVAAPPAPAAKASGQVKEGTVIVNRATKQRQIWKGGKWTPAPSLP